MIEFLVALVLFGVVLYLVNSYIPMDPKIKQLVNIIAIIAAVLWALKVFGLFNGFSNVGV